MKVLHVAAEVFPHVKTGGLADVVAALPAALCARGIDARVLLPGLPAILEGVAPLQTLARIGPAFGAAAVSLKQGWLPQTNVPLYVVDAPWLYAREGGPYGGPDGREWADNPERFALLGWIAAHLASGEFAAHDYGWHADVLHAHDWHAGLAAAYLDAHPARRVRTVFTIHNLAYQGLFPLERGAALGLAPYHLAASGLEFHGRGSFMKAGLMWSDRITTVSPRYAEEIRTPALGCGLDGVLEDRRGDLSGILNGVDTALWNPATDRHLDSRYDAGDRAGKARAKQALQRGLGLAVDAGAPLFAVVSRLTHQKGIDLVLGALPDLIAAGGQFALLGSGDAALEDAFRDAAAAYPGKVAARIGYDEPLAHRIFAGADAIVVPSRFEPCGLTQLYGLRYGTVPIVRDTGGLADTVIDASAAPEAGTGFVFQAATSDALAVAMRDAALVYREPARWTAIVARGMAIDHSWDGAAREYAALYESLAG